MGRHCGDIALYSGIASGAEIIVVPEIAFDMGVGFGKSYEDNLELIKNIKDINTKDMNI